MSGLLVVIGIIYIIVRVAKEKSDDAEVRRHAESVGLPYYASSDGFRDVKTNKKYYK